MIFYFLLNLIFANAYSCFESNDVTITFQGKNGQIEKNGCNLKIEQGHIFLGTAKSQKTHYFTLQEVGSTADENYLPRRKKSNGNTNFLLYAGLYQSNNRTLKVFDGYSGSQIAEYDIDITNNILSKNTTDINQTTTSLKIRQNERALFRSFTSANYIEDYEGQIVNNANNKNYTNRSYWDFNYPLLRPIANQGTFKKTGLFAENRNYTNEDNVMHEGLDMIIHDAGTYTHVTSPARGKVIGIKKDSEELELHGNTVIIDHGEGIISVLAHLYDIEKNIYVGKIVSHGEDLGEMGNSGATTKTHVHWTVLINGALVDPEDFILFFSF